MASVVQVLKWVGGRLGGCKKWNMATSALVEIEVELKLRLSVTIITNYAVIKDTDI